MPRSDSPRPLLAGLALLAALGVGLSAVEAQPVPPPPPGASAYATPLTGRVAEVFGHHVVVEGPAGRVLVDLGPRSAVQDLRPGETVTVTGRPGGPDGRGPLRAESLRRGDGPVVALRDEERGGRPGPRGEGRGPERERDRGPDRGPDRDRGGPRAREEARVTPEQVTAAVRAAGYTPTGTPERRPRHFEVSATNPRGEAVELHVDLDGRLYKEVWRRAETGARPEAPSEAEASRLAASAGYTPTGITMRRRHAEVLANRADGTPVELHVDSQGIRELRFPR